MFCRASTQSIIAVPSIAELEYGPVIRTLSPGETFGELALLQPQCLRTATVIATLSHNEEGSGPATDSLQGSRQSDDEFSSNSARERVSLIKVTRQLFDESVTSMQVTQLENRLRFLMQFNVRCLRCFPCCCISTLIKVSLPRHLIVHSAL